MDHLQKLTISGALKTIMTINPQDYLIQAAPDTFSIDMSRLKTDIDQLVLQHQPSYYIIVKEFRQALSNYA